ncbi:YSIRK-type signal peptide-containing protein, partial [uncultured Granulicatella sp.]|uniref:YSIRK-type signal peptide-containing protein n=1 Tax=uncultured Granulicatella sp. TaxID=316089 RepID=UPI0028D826EB
MLGKNNQIINQKKFGRKFEKYSIKKLKVGVASVLVGAGFFLGYHVEARETPAPITDSGYNRTGTGNSEVVDAQEFVMVTHEKPGGVVEDVAILKTKFSENLDQLKKDYPGFTAT